MIRARGFGSALLFNVELIGIREDKACWPVGRRVRMISLISNGKGKCWRWAEDGERLEKDVEGGGEKNFVYWLRSAVKQLGAGRCGRAAGVGSPVRLAAAFLAGQQ